jgi:hypothetical protein
MNMAFFLKWYDMIITNTKQWFDIAYVCLFVCFSRSFNNFSSINISFQLADGSGRGICIQIMGPKKTRQETPKSVGEWEDNVW